MFEYPVSVMAQIVAMAAFFFGVQLELESSGRAYSLVYNALVEIHPSLPEYAGYVIMIFAVITFVGHFIRDRLMIILGSDALALFWIFVFFIYFDIGFGIGANVFAGPYVLLIAYSLIYTTLHFNNKISPFRALTAPFDS